MESRATCSGKENDSDNIKVKAGKFPCPTEGCTKEYNRMDNLKVHLKRIHDETDATKPGRFTCHECEKTFYHAKKLVGHYTDDHKLQIETEHKQFPSLCAFKKWKDEEESSTYTSFSQPKGETLHDSGGLDSRTLLYVCCRDGQPRVNKQPRKTLATRRGNMSRKLQGAFCISRMVVCENLLTKQVTVDYVSTHTGHKPSIEECKHLPLPPSLRKEVQEKFAAGITIERIMDDIRSEVGGRAERHQYEKRVNRKHFITRQDLRNITRVVRNYSRHRHSEDAISVDRIVAELSHENPSPVIAYKPQGSKHPEYHTLQDDTFLLAVMTSYQSQLFEEFGSKVVCMDSTHKTNEYKFKLVTLLVVDEFHKGQPIAWAISDKEDEVVMEVVFRAIRQRCPAGVITTLMTDDSLSGANACSSVYPGVTHILCKWHVDRAWQLKIHTVVKDEEHKAEIYTCLWLLMTEEDRAKFSHHLQLFIQFWQVKEPDFIQYFQNTYATRAEKWALSFRHFDHGDVDTNNFVESFHNKLKSNPKYLNHCVNRRCDDLLETLLRFEEDMFHERKYQEVMSSADASSKYDGHDRHIRGRDIPKKDVKELEHGVFTVSSSASNQVYTVHVKDVECHSMNPCVPQCTQPECGYVCRHRMQCTCYDYMHGHLCKHVHRISMVLQLKLAEEESLTESVHDNDDDFLCTPSPKKQKLADLSAQKRSIEDYLHQVQQGIQSVQEPDVLNRVLSLVMQASSAIKSAGNPDNQHPFVVKEKFPPAQKNETQLQFKQTSGNPGRKRKNIQMRCPATCRDGLDETWARMSEVIADTTVYVHEVSVCNTEPGATKHSQETTKLQSQSSSGETMKLKRKRCGVCTGCVAEDCGTCKYCRDKPKFSGPGKLKQSCTKRRCLHLH